MHTKHDIVLPLLFVGVCANHYCVDTAVRQRWRTSPSMR